MDERGEVVRGLIDGREVEVPAGVAILSAARQNGLGIPTLCHHEGLPPEGGCRLCLVELGGRLVASCQYPLRASGFDVKTMSPEVKKARRFVISLMLARAPDSKTVLDLAAAYDVAPDQRLQRAPADSCLRCARCVRACADSWPGPQAISLVGRGAGRMVSGPYFKPPSECSGCLACAKSCPTGAIKYSDDGKTRTIWGRAFSIVPCPVCGRPVGTEEQLAFEGAVKLCPACRRKEMAESLGSAPAQTN